MPIALLLFSVSAFLTLCAADFFLEEVPGLYRWRRGGTDCEVDLVIRRTIGQTIPGSEIRGSNFMCSGGLIELSRGRLDSGNDLTHFLAKSKPFAGMFIVGRVVDDIHCIRQDRTRFSYRRGQIWNFVEPKRDLLLDFSSIFDPRSKLNYANPFYELDDGREYIIIGDRCLYRQSWYICFPASARVTLESGASKRMDELAVGDRVAVGRGQFSDVFMWTHKQPTKEQYSFRRIDMASGESLTLTRGHYLRVGGRLMPAGEAAVGETVELADGTVSRIVRTSEVMERGFFNPQTLHGDIVVDGVVTTTYTNAIAPTKAHAMLAPLRGLYKMIWAVRRLQSGKPRQEL